MNSLDKNISDQQPNLSRELVYKRNKTRQKNLVVGFSIVFLMTLLFLVTVVKISSSV